MSEATKPAAGSVTSGTGGRLTRLLAGVPYGFCVVVGWVLLGMGLLTAWSVLLRYLIRRPIVWTYEAGGYVILACSVAGVAYALQLQRHIGVDAFVNKLRPKAYRIVRWVNLFATVCWGVLVLWGTWIIASASMRTGKLSESARIPVYPFQMVVPVGMVIFILIGLFMLYRDAKRLLGKAPLEGGKRETPGEGD